jgi:cell volume regulation protein A
VTEPAATAAILAAIGLLLLLSALASPLPGRLGVPALVLFLLVGIAAGEEGLGGIPFGDYGLAFRLGCIALVLILFDGGLNTSLAAFRAAAMRAILLATLGVVTTALVVASVGIALGLSLPLALLVGAVVSSTDAAAVFSVLRSSGVRLQASTATTLEVESGLNDPMAMLLTVLTTEFVLGTERTTTQATLHFAQQFAVGSASGVVIGWLARSLLPVLRLPAAGLYPVITVAIAFLSFGVATLLDGSGFLAAYLAGLLTASGGLPYRQGVRRVHDSLAWLAQILMFVLLGLLVFPSRLVPALGIGLALAAVLALVARPLAVLLSLAPFHIPWRERVFIGWVGLRGAVPIVLATYPVLRGVRDGDRLFHLVFFVVLVNSLVPGATVAWVARKLGLARGAEPEPAASIEVVSLREFPGEFVWYFVAAASPAAGAALQALPIPEGSVAALVVRGAEVIAPRGGTVLQAADQICLFATAAERGVLEHVFGAREETVPP